MKTYTLLLTFLGLSILSGCFFDCRETVDPDITFDPFEAQLEVNDSIITVGESFTFSLEIPKDLIDQNGNSQEILGGVEIIHRFSELSNTPSGTDVFSIDKTLADEFNDYFDINIIKGSQVAGLIFLYELELENDFYKLEIEYIPKKEGEFLTQIGLRNLGISLPQLDEDQCYIGDTETFNSWITYQDTPLNKVAELTDGVHAADLAFAIIVKE